MKPQSQWEVMRRGAATELPAHRGRNIYRRIEHRFLNFGSICELALQVQDLGMRDQF